MSPAMKNNTIQQTTLSTKTKTFLDWNDFEPVHEEKAKPKARVKLSLCKVEAFEAYWLKYVGDDSSPHELNDIETFYDGFDLEDERMHMRCQMFRVKQLAKSIAKTTPFVLAHLEAKAQAQWLEALAREIATTTPKVLAHLDAKAKAQTSHQLNHHPPRQLRLRVVFIHMIFRSVRFFHRFDPLELADDFPVIGFYLRLPIDNKVHFVPGFLFQVLNGLG